MKTITTLICILIIIFLAQSKLEQVVSLFRHGARYHLNAYYDGNDTKLSWGYLTSVGMRQHENLGKTLRKQYIDKLGFLNANYDSSEIEVYSTSVNRTIQSAMSQFYGLYPTGTGPKLIYVKQQYHIPPFSNQSDAEQQNFALPLGHQPIPIKFNNKIFLDDCKNEQNQINKNIATKKSQYDNMNLTYTPFLNKMADLFSIKRADMTFSKLNSIYDTMQVDRYLGKPLPSELSNADLLNMRHLHYWHWSFIYSLNLSRAINSYKLQKVIDSFDARIKNSSYPIKWTFLSAHDSDVLPMQVDLNITSSICIEQLYRTGKTSALNCQPGPQFASSIIWQLYSEGNQHYVKIRFNGKYINLCEKKSEQCSYDEFKTRVKRIILPDVDAFCGNKVDQPNPRQKYLDLQERLNSFQKQ